MISAGWTRLRRRLLGPHFDRPDGESIEVRRFDQNDTLVEQRAPSIEVYVLNLTLQDNLQPRQRVDQLETEVENMKTQHHENPKRKPGPKRRSRKKK